MSIEFFKELFSTDNTVNPAKLVDLVKVKSLMT